jgi:hypothetical protein
LFNGLLMQHLQPHQQARFQTPVQTLAAVGRGIGPFMGTVLMQTGDQRHVRRPSPAFARPAFATPRSPAPPSPAPPSPATAPSVHVAAVAR